MSKLTFDEIRKRGLLLYEYVRGSKLYHTDIPSSDEDTGGVFIAPPDFDFKYQEEVSDEKNDNKWWELGKFMEMVLSSNPGVLEAFFVPDELVKYVHPMFKEILKHGPEFITKACFKPFGSYAVQQIKKAQGQNKKIHWDMDNMKRMSPIDFCYTFDGRQGSINISKWLDKNGLRQDCCGLVNLVNMKDCYLVYYDFAQHFRLSVTTLENECYKKSDFYNFMYNHFENQIIERKRKSDEIFSELNKNEKNTEKVQERTKELLQEYPEKFIISPDDIFEYIKQKTSTPYGGHCGIINNDGTSNTVRLCCTNKDETPICMMTYNADGYGTHCKKYKEYEEWKSKRNKARYESNMWGEKSNNPDMKYDVKNMYHCFRNVAMCTEIAQGKGIILDRRGIDKNFLIHVRLRTYGYSELMEKLTEMTKVMQKACDESKIKEKIDEEMVRKLVSDFRRNFYFKEVEKTNQDSFEISENKNIEQKLQVLSGLLDKLEIKKEDVMLTGSIALKKHNMLPKGRNIKDIDIVVKADEELEKTFQIVTKLNGGNTFWMQQENKIEGVKHKPYIFSIDNQCFNVWTQSPDTDFDTEIKCKEGWWIATVKHILDAKKSYGREKDLCDINIIAAEMLNLKKNDKEEISEIIPGNNEY